jgi:NADH dehydrogenase FAD-containing subunit
LINGENFFLFSPMLHEVAASDLDLTNIVSPVPHFRAAAGPVILTGSGNR